MINQALFSSKDKSKKLKCRLLQFLFGALKVNIVIGFLCLFGFLNCTNISYSTTGIQFGIFIVTYYDTVPEIFTQLSAE